MPVVPVIETTERSTRIVAVAVTAAALFAIGYLGYSVWASRQARGRINHDAHLAGALAGLAFVALVDPQRFAGALLRWLS